MEKVIYAPAVMKYLNDLTDILYDEEYFGFKSDCIRYVKRITDDIETYIHTKRHRIAPHKLSHYGTYYTSFPANKRTTWYVFFDKIDKRFFIGRICNNHVEDASLLEGLR